MLYKLSHPFFRIYWKIFNPKTYGSRAVILCENSILLVKHINMNYWALPGGTIDNGESPEQCLLRELEEELSLAEIKLEYKLGEYTSTKEGKRDTVYVFIVKVFSLDFQRQWELEDAKWFDLDSLPYNISPAGLRRIKEYKVGNQNVLSEW